MLSVFVMRFEGVPAVCVDNWLGDAHRTLTITGAGAGAQQLSHKGNSIIGPDGGLDNRDTFVSDSSACALIVACECEESQQ